MLCWLEFALVFFSGLRVTGLWVHLLASVKTGSKPKVGIFSWKKNLSCSSLVPQSYCRSESPGSSLKIQWPGLHAKPTESETLSSPRGDSYIHTSVGAPSPGIQGPGAQWRSGTTPTLSSHSLTGDQASLKYLLLLLPFYPGHSWRHSKLYSLGTHQTSLKVEERGKHYLTKYSRLPAPPSG